MARLAYLFERFPTFTQTFCVREVQGLRAHGWKFPVFSIRSTEQEPIQNFPVEVRSYTENLPKKWNKPWLPDYWRGRSLRSRLRKEWGMEGDRQRANEAIWLRRRCRQLGVHHVHAHFAGMAARAAYWLHRISDCSYSITAHANDFMDASKQRYLSEIFKHALFIVTETDFSVEYIEKRFPETVGKVHRVYNGIHTSEFVSRKSALSPPRILSVGRCVEKKGYFDLIEACKQLQDLDFSCDLVGSGPLEDEMRRAISKNRLDKKVRVAGSKSCEEIRHMLEESTLFVLACRTEKEGGSDNLPTVILEAMSASRPVVSTRIAGIPEMIVDGKTGYLVSEQNPEALAEAMRRVMTQPAHAEEMGRCGNERVHALFDTKVTIPHLIQIFEKYGLAA